MFIHTLDESVIGSGGRVLHFSIERFIKDICEGDYCFICGISPSLADFNDEHVVPDWILRKYGLHAKMIGLPNGTAIRYDQYKVPCCMRCNQLLGETFEKPISNLVSQGYAKVAQSIKDNGPWLFFNWLALIFLKTHLKDKSLRLHRDSRKGDEKISDFYTWEELHHIHCVARSFYTIAEVDAKVFGSFFLLPAQTGQDVGTFDYGDLYAPRTMLLRLGNIAFVCVLNDSCAAWNVVKDDLRKISAELSPLQLREFMARCAFINLDLKKRPHFYSDFTPLSHHRISADIPSELALEAYDLSQYGALLYASCKDILSAAQNENIDEIREYIKQGRMTFLFDENGNFKTDSLEFRERNPISEE